jgi:hypothetical protein
MWKGIGLVALFLAIEVAFLLHAAMPSGLRAAAPAERAGATRVVPAARVVPARAARSEPAAAPAAPPCDPIQRS